MNSKMTAKSQLSTTERKKQKQNLSKQLEQEQNRITEMEITWRVINGEREEENGGERYRK